MFGYIHRVRELDTPLESISLCTSYVQNQVSSPQRLLLPFILRRTVFLALLFDFSLSSPNRSTVSCFLYLFFVLSSFGIFSSLSLQKVCVSFLCDDTLLTTYLRIRQSKVQEQETSPTASSGFQFDFVTSNSRRSCR